MNQPSTATIMLFLRRTLVRLVSLIIKTRSVFIQFIIHSDGRISSLMPGI